MLNKIKVIKDFLVSKGFIKEQELKFLIELHHSTHQRIDELMRQEKLAGNIAINESMLEQLGIELKKISGEQIALEILDKVPSVFAFKHRILPLSYKDQVLTMATDILLNFLVIDNFKDILQTNVDVVLVSSDDLNRNLEQSYALPLPHPGPSLKEKVEQELDEAPIIKLINTLIIEARKSRASDIHIEPLANKLRIRYRVDGLLKEISPPPRRLQNSIISRVKLMAGMNLAEKRLPQDGRIRLKSEKYDMDLRVSTLPATYGESVVLRILDKKILRLSELGFSDSDQQKFEQLIKLSNGVILVTGPTGSGKTTTLYSALSCVNTPGKKLMTVEDPVEYQMNGINQMQVKPHIGLSFSSGLRSILRQAPDIIMVGEIRDLETAAIAMQASLTGHLIFSTLHTNDASTAITRLTDMGIDSYLIAATIQAVLAQRLVRLICPNCKTAYHPSPAELKIFELKAELDRDVTFYRGEGCKRCNFSGYYGRVGIFEMLIIDERIRALIYKNTNSSKIRELAVNSGMKTLKLDGREKVLKGITTVAEVIRVCQSDLE
ncbi:MAG: ATPase, T2SS/T4P/T4SS family [Candidatus Omnitrophota bacterium]